jgi:quercetin dioxygenase-like cupin family protein
MRTRRGNLPFSLTGNRAPPPGCRLRAVTIAPGCQLAGEAVAWAHALIVVELGELEVECAGGGRASFTAGAVLCFRRLDVRWLRNRGGNQEVLLSILSAAAGPVTDQAS